ncbi:cyclin-C-like [Convolutriloba macropyga]|uniref:cyclin-C-like n=1 Tax=Convolutriloba macropyga TaxID=536237 RepID=UPI003F5257DE
MSGNFWNSSHFRQWLFDKEDLLLGRQADLQRLSTEEYQKVHIFFGQLIQAIGEELKVRQQVIATAIIYFKRFYSRYSLKDIDPILLCPTSLFLASKVEEVGASPNSRLIEKCTAAIKSSMFKHVFQFEEYPYKVNDIHDCEFLLMEVMDCCLIVFQPYRPLTQFCEDIGDQNNELLKASWLIMNDVLRSDLILTQPPFMLALAALLIACCTYRKQSSGNMSHANLSLDASGGLGSLSLDHKNWFADCTVDLDQLTAVVNDIMSFFELWTSFEGNEIEEMKGVLRKFQFVRSMLKLGR